MFGCSQHTRSCAVFRQPLLVAGLKLFQQCLQTLQTTKDSQRGLATRDPVFSSPVALPWINFGGYYCCTLKTPYNASYFGEALTRSSNSHIIIILLKQKKGMIAYIQMLDLTSAFNITALLTAMR